MIGFPVKKKWRTITAVWLFLGGFLLASCAAQTDHIPLSDVKAAADDMETFAALATQQLEDMRGSSGDAYDALGFEEEAFLNMSVGTPFIAYRFDRFGNLLSDDIYSCPLIYQDEVVGIISASYREESKSYSYTFGAMYGPELNVVINSANLDISHGVLIGGIDDKFFATDGVGVEILSDVPREPAVSVEEIRNVAGRLIAAASANYQPFVPIRTVPAPESSEDN